MALQQQQQRQSTKCKKKYEKLSQENNNIRGETRQLLKNLTITTATKQKSKKKSFNIISINRQTVEV